MNTFLVIILLGLIALFVYAYEDSIRIDEEKMKKKRQEQEAKL